MRQQERAYACRAIAPTDRYKWLGLSLDGAGSLDVCRVYIGPTRADARPLKTKSFVFRDSSTDSGDCWCFAVSQDGTLLAASFETSTALVWRLSDGLIVQRLHHHGHTGWIRSVAFSPNGHHLVSGSNDNTAIVWDIRSGRALLRLEGHSDQVWAVGYSPDGSRIATGSRDKSVKMWDGSSGECLHSIHLGEEVSKVMFSRDGSRLAVQLSSTGAICDVQSGTCVATFQHEGSGNMRLSLSPQGDRVVTGTDDGKAKIWDAVSGEEVEVLLVLDRPPGISELAVDEHTCALLRRQFEVVVAGVHCVVSLARGRARSGGPV